MPPAGQSSSWLHLKSAGNPEDFFRKTSPDNGVRDSCYVGADWLHSYSNLMDVTFRVSPCTSPVTSTRKWSSCRKPSGPQRSHCFPRHQEIFANEVADVAGSVGEAQPSSGRDEASCGTTNEHGAGAMRR